MLKVYSSLQITTVFKSILTELAKIIHVCIALFAGLEKKTSTLLKVSLDDLEIFLILLFQIHLKVY